MATATWHDRVVPYLTSPTDFLREPAVRMNFEDVAVNREQQYSLGIEKESGKFYVSIAVANRLVDYEEYYEIDKAMFERYRADLDSALDFVKRCRNHQEDSRLMMKPCPDRGTAV